MSGQYQNQSQLIRVGEKSIAVSENGSQGTPSKASNSAVNAVAASETLGGGLSNHKSGHLFPKLEMGKVSQSVYDNKVATETESAQFTHKRMSRDQMSALRLYTFKNKLS